MAAQQMDSLSFHAAVAKAELVCAECDREFAVVEQQQYAVLGLARRSQSAEFDRHVKAARLLDHETLKRALADSLHEKKEGRGDLVKRNALVTVGVEKQTHDVITRMRQARSDLYTAQTELKQFTACQDYVESTKHPDALDGIEYPLETLLGMYPELGTPNAEQTEMLRYLPVCFKNKSDPQCVCTFCRQPIAVYYTGVQHFKVHIECAYLTLLKRAGVEADRALVA